MANALKLLIQRKCINKEFSWSFFKCDNGNGNSNNKRYPKQYCNKGSNINIQRRHQHDGSNNCCNNGNSNNLSANNEKMLLQQNFQEQELIDNQINMKHFNTMEASASASGCACSSKKNDNTAIVELKRKFYLSKLLHMRYCSSVSGSCSNSSLDQRSVFYITLLIVIYCCVLIRASAATLSTTIAADAKNDINITTAVAAATVATNSSQAIDRNIALKYQLDNETSKHLRVVRNAANVPDDDDDSSYHDDEFDEYDALINNKSAKGKYIGAPCNNYKCESTLIHVSCDKETQLCGCEKNYPVQLGLTKGCAKAKKLGEQCFYDETCIYNDENSLCVQVRHNAMCQCVSGFHSVSYTKPTRRVFCTQDLKELKSDLPTLLGVSTGIAVLAGLICMVLHLFSKTKYPRHRNFGDANLPPPIMYSSDTVQSGRPSSRSSIRSSGSIGSFGNRRSSTTAQPSGGQAGSGTSAGSKGILVSTSRTGAARSAAILLISCHISELSKQNSRQTSRQTSGAGCSANSRDNLDEGENLGGGGGCDDGSGGNTDGTRSCDSILSMTRHLQRQLNQQRQLLSLELSPKSGKSKNHNKIRAMLGMNGIDNYRTDDDDFNSLDNGNMLQIGALPTPASATPRLAVIRFNYS